MFLLSLLPVLFWFWLSAANQHRAPWAGSSDSQTFRFCLHVEELLCVSRASAWRWAWSLLPSSIIWINHTGKEENMRHKRLGQEVSHLLLVIFHIFPPCTRMISELTAVSVWVCVFVVCQHWAVAVFCCELVKVSEQISTSVSCSSLCELQRRKWRLMDVEVNK